MHAHLSHSNATCDVQVKQIRLSIWNQYATCIHMWKLSCKTRNLEETNHGTTNKTTWNSGAVFTHHSTVLDYYVTMKIYQKNDVLKYESSLESVK
jgi:hypothetical protein